LFGIEPSVRARTLLPLGAMTKDEVRAHARRFGLALHDKPESQDICFVPDGDYARLVRSRTESGFTPGEIRHVDGRKVGDHEGTANFTIGQRRGLRVAMGEPVYVTGIDPVENVVTIGPKSAVLGSHVRVTEVNWLCERPTAPIRAAVQIRYHHRPAEAMLSCDESDRIVTIDFDEPQPAITPGQAAVFYQGDEVIGGGWIES
jgi:tRNA-specific 2-thiouridylase